MLGMGDAMAGLFLPDGLHPSDLPHIQGILASYGDALERILGTVTGSIQFVEMVTLQEWVAP
jgi:hypothetical protein